ncbi:mannose-1-phosphate guanylyltransferase/mannose-6-phosphate isomerase [Roseobacter sp. HKCCD9010]|uniref:mannose-1-phosphate guanylyltransferase/mannose-6-phosphate isomerase n=1 Tax=unclassified Roseobacter TaxID=196798 RepID=UPI001492517E|nr:MULTISPECIES: mannose-1-phosphate guanylyltransferase/mannose-6-phosphate isomerase [unclassified Roseobacter]MBF9050478.1 mannose-1-phosphate guanylyltransferase/mannose-6-phosphate isomerase [Rhodobacterales bacterium HKCCD4356]NNV12105.1 mannose-1-phosphate guanylyltransferase/mannose-6-phosphate isomerase [Roseobacter sp. HKCCD7357]NNV17119.1 mannose-1-phosphate guanylyltransferase/mannose-6-phosphate isomerase [Roseobacter sp. HKCCD8768]NNV26348.1 mannose-1-phosphate guanylyltransferase
MTQQIHPVLLCGGSGTRLWPLSRKSYPKQFVKLTSDESLFQASAKRLTGPEFAPPMIVTGGDFRFIVIEQLAALEMVASDILIEPAAKNTAPAICAAALALEAKDSGALMLVAPSDHVIPDGKAFHDTVQTATTAALDGRLVTFGIRPDRAETGYGWLELTERPLADFSPIPQPLKSFVEKPDQAKADTLLAGGMHLWNAGIFLFTNTAILKAFAENAPEVLSACRAAQEGAEKDLSFTRLKVEPWDALPDISIDYAVMERAENLTVVPYGGAWSDLGDWDAVWREGDADDKTVVTTGPATALDCDATLLHATSEAQQLVGIGLTNIVAVAMPDAVLVAHKDRAQDVKKTVAALKAKGVSQATTLPRDYRPWGWYESIVTGSRFQVKRIVVHPGASLSLQSHHHRAEHWIVVEGTAKVTVDDEVKLVTENQSVYIPLGALHRMENPGKVPLTLIEVQTGSYLGEDDIIRYEDVYARRQGAKG